MASCISGGRMPTGTHRFIVHEYDVQYENNHCECWDARRGAPTDENGRKLCKHMLAAQYWLQARHELQEFFEEQDRHG